MLLSELAAAFDLILSGEDCEFTGLSTLDEATESEVSFFANPRYRGRLAQSRACAVILTANYAHEVKRALISPAPYRDFARAAALFARREGEFSGISAQSSIHPSARLGENCTVHPFAHIGARSSLGPGCVVFPGAYIGEDCALGADCVLYPNAVVLAGVEMGDGCILRSGAVIGTEGFGFVRIDGKMQAVPQIGSVRLEGGVDIGANSCVDRATLGSTSIGRDSKLDNLVQIGHNVSLGEQCLIISQVGIAGSAKVGDRVTMAGQAGIAGHLNIGDDVTIGPQSGVPKDIPGGVTGGGTPFMESGIFMRSFSLLPRLPEMHKRLLRLEKELAALKELMAKEEE
ncbi:MAG: UDP-3-O-(3-hydroxymyristoyl)glucosamine N-acyltransferase [Desulfovibrio sp.]|jgi:UDP-3-O-[3-hydroxymyristoyl] glucosamine N-acyltransferase|nr:UDP-3-O-(3-hydroxymyristoyl)glucosamine N-acyltransferase [Desulfovibrio sp.]